jgi:hypothetical protein
MRSALVPTSSRTGGRLCGTCVLHSWLFLHLALDGSGPIFFFLWALCMAVALGHLACMLLFNLWLYGVMQGFSRPFIYKIFSSSKQ